MARENFMRLTLGVLLLCCSPTALSQDQPPSCVRFDEMAARVEAVSVIRYISEAEFRDAEKRATQVRNPRNVFAIGTTDYSRSEINGKPVFHTFTRDVAKETEFLKWYNGGGKEEMPLTGMQCAAEHKDKWKAAWILGIVTVAHDTEVESLDQAIRASIVYINDLTNEVIQLKDRHNAMLKNLTIYHNAVENYMTSVNEIMDRRRVEVPQFQFNFTPPPMITCTGDTSAISNSITYPSSVDTMTTARTVIHCN